MRDILCGRPDVWVNLDSVFKASIPSFCEIVVTLGLAMLRSFCVATCSTSDAWTSGFIATRSNQTCLNKRKQQWNNDIQCCFPS